MLKKIIALFCFLLFAAPALAQEEFDGAVQTASAQVRRHDDIAGGVDISTLNFRRAAQTPNALLTLTLEGDDADGTEEATGTINLVGDNNTGGIFMNFSGFLIDTSRRGNRVAGQEKVINGFVLTPGVTFNPDTGVFTGLNGDVIEFEGTLEMNVVSREDRDGNFVSGVAQMKVFPNTAVIRTVQGDGTLSDAFEPVLLNIRMGPMKLTPQPVT